MSKLPTTRISPDLLPSVESPDGPWSGAVLRARRLARTDYREQVYALNVLKLGDPKLLLFVNILSGSRRRLDGVGAVSVEPWHNSDSGVHVVVHQAAERHQ